MRFTEGFLSEKVMCSSLKHSADCSVENEFGEAREEGVDRETR